MKGITDVEFVLSVVVFLTAVSFVSFSIVSKIPALKAEVANEDLRDKAYMISELLISDTGEPPNWNAASVKRLGLMNGINHMLEAGKLSSLNSMCSTPAGYDNVKDLLGQNLTNVRISIIDSSGLEIVNCKPQVIGNLAPKFQIVRFAAMNTNGDIAKMTVETIR